MTSRLDQVEWKLDCLQSRMDALVKADEDPCWEGYEQAGTKEKGGETVPNCVKADASGYSAAKAAYRQLLEAETAAGLAISKGTGAMGLPSEEQRLDPERRRARAEYERAKKAAADFGVTMRKQYAKEIREEKDRLGPNWWRS